MSELSADGSAGNAPDPLKQALWQDILSIRGEVTHLKQLNQCLAYFENTVRQLQLENSRLRSIESALLEHAQVVERGLRLARESRYEKDREILQLREQNKALAQAVEELRQQCQQKHSIYQDYHSQFRAKGLTKDTSVDHRLASRFRDKCKAEPRPNRDEEWFALKFERAKCVLDQLLKDTARSTTSCKIHEEH